tara:strand:- start:6455 stop:6628 length:174 start_codon:yes stop_codon:yes gene_type:complete
MDGGQDVKPEPLMKELKTTCASCNKLIDENDIIGDGTNRGLCCVPDYYDDNATPYPD